MTRIGLIAGLIGLTAATAVADPYWVSWSGDSFPEEDGWSRTFTDANGIAGQGGATRKLADGVMVLDSRRDWDIVDFYQMSREIDPELGEEFVLRWGLEVDEVSDNFPFDAGISVFSDQSTVVAFRFGEDGFQSLRESDETIPLDLSVPHEFVLRSADMATYSLFVDGVHSRSGVFFPTVSESRIGWGDVIQGAASLSSWDYVEFGVVPEPASWLLVFTLCVFGFQRRLR